MKNFIFALAIVGSSLLGACQSPGADKAETTTTETITTDTAEKTTGTTETAQLAYICPMKCEGSASHTPGKCPVCSMDLIKNPDYKGAAADSSAL